MSNEKQKRVELIGGLIDNADTLADGSTGLTAAGTTLNSPGLAAITGGVGSTEYMWILFDPDGIFGSPDWSKITALTGGATTATIVRTGTARDHPRDIPWVHPIRAFDVPLVVYKTADESVTSSTTLQDDDHLQFPIAANETWEVEFVLFYEAATTGDFNPAVTAPTGAVGRLGHAGLDTAVTSETGSTRWFSQTLGNSLNLGGAGAGQVLVARLWALVVNGSTAGDVKLRWAQVVSNATATIVKQYSYLKAQRIG